MAGTGLLLGAVGVYGVVAYVVVRRRKEIGVRIALGARAPALVGGMVAGALAAVLVGAIIGVALAALAIRLTASVLFDVTGTDPLTSGLALATVAVTAFAASFVPAWRASRVDANVVLRED